MASAVVVMLVLTWGGNPLCLAVARDHGDDRGVRRAGVRLRLACAQCGRAVPALPAAGWNGGALRDAQAAGRWAHHCAHRAPALYYEGRLSFERERGGLALIPLRRGSTCGAAIAGRTMARAQTLQAVAITGTSVATIFGAVLT